MVYVAEQNKPEKAMIYWVVDSLLKYLKHWTQKIMFVCLFLFVWLNLHYRSHIIKGATRLRFQKLILVFWLPEATGTE